MRTHRQSRNITSAFAAFVTIGVLGACADSSVAPSRPAFKGPAAYSTVVGTKTFTYSSAEGAAEHFGQHLINMPAGSVCDPEVSTYGPTEWDAPCTPLDGSIVITARMFEDEFGHPYVDFQPALRFVPTTEVTLYLRSGKAPFATGLAIAYCNDLGLCYDESLTDASLSTFRVGRSAILGRRIKHFSGYSLAAGETCPGTLTEERDGTLMCYVDDGGASRRSGYILASGLADSRNGNGVRKPDNQE